METVIVIWVVMALLFSALTGVGFFGSLCIVPLIIIAIYCNPF